MGTRLLKTINLLEKADKGKLKNLNLPDMQITVLIEVDKELEALIDKGKEGLRWQQFIDAADDYTANAKKVIAAELITLNEKVGKLSLKEAEAMVTTTWQVLKQVALGQEQGVNAQVEKVWANACRRSQNLSKFKTKCVVKALVGVLTISTSLASMIASGGANLLSVMVIFKTVAELGLLASDIAQGVEDAADELLGLRADVIEKIEAGRQPGRAGEVVSDLTPIFQKLTGTVKTVDVSQIKLDAKVASLDKSLDTMLGSLNAGLDKLGKIITANPDQVALIKEVRLGNKALIAQIISTNQDLKPYRNLSDTVAGEVKSWKAKRQPKTVAAIRAASFVKLASGLGTAVRTFGKIAGLPIP